jgi:protein-L-isoaspartate(D-aspartate) O-methyltransferase
MPVHLAEPLLSNAIQRRTMVDCQIRTFDVTDQAVLAQFLDVPRDKFLPTELAPFAYSDMALTLAADKSQSAVRHLLPPAILARLVQAAAVKPSDKVLDVAPATGYSTAILAGLAKAVVALEADPALCATIKANLAAIGSTAPQIVNGPLAAGVAAEAPYDVIFVNGAVEAQLDGLFQQLRSGGRLIAIVHKTTAPGYGASQAVRFESQSGRISSAALFDADAPVLAEFRKAAEFIF